MPSSLEPPIFPNLALGLTGISDRALRAHLRVYGQAWRELRSIRAEAPKLAWSAPSGGAAGGGGPDVQVVLGTRVGDLKLEIGGKLKDALAQLRGELNQRGISWFPTFYLGDSDFWTADQATSINLPWYLADAGMWWLVNDQTTRYTEAELLMVLRHEVAHAIGYAFELWRRRDWVETFGDFGAPYRDAYDPDPKSTDFVRHLHRSGDNANAHYAQKHADEDWAETFATWLGQPDWREQYAGWPGALRKLVYVQDLIEGQGAAYGEPKNTRPGRRIPYQTLNYTVGEFLGVRPLGEWSPRSALKLREARVQADVRLHEIYFAGLRRAAHLIPNLPADGSQSFGIAGGHLIPNRPMDGSRFAAAARSAHGSVDAWAEDARAACGSAGGWLLVAWDREEGRLRNLALEAGAACAPAGWPPLLAVCLHEHAYAPDYCTRKDLYLAAALAAVDWAVIERRAELAGISAS